MKSETKSSSSPEPRTGSSPPSGTPTHPPSGDPGLDWMIANGEPLTRANYLSIFFPEEDPEHLDGELEALLPEQFRE